MLAFIIQICGNPISVKATDVLLESADTYNCTTRDIIFNAVTPDDVEVEMERHSVEWNYPLEREKSSKCPNLIQIGYRGPVELRQSCAMSHFKLWNMVQHMTDPVLILEHDAEFIREFDPEFEIQDGTIIGINDPRGATRKANVYSSGVEAAYREAVPSITGDFINGYPDCVLDAPCVDSGVLTPPFGAAVPQGLAGNSAYILTPGAAVDLVNAVYQYGLWPNDAIMCRQILGNECLKQLYPYVTKVQGTPSTTTPV